MFNILRRNEEVILDFIYSILFIYILALSHAFYVCNEDFFFFFFWFRLCLFWVKITSGNAFPEMRLFGWSGKFYFP